MTVPFPVVPRGTVVTPHLIRVGGDLTSSLGGPTQRITRLGSRYAADIELPSLDAECAAQWLASVLTAEATGDTLSLTMPQMIPDARTMVGVAGGGAAGSNTIALQSMAHPPQGAWFSFLAGGRNYLHFVTAVMPGEVKISPLLRITIPNGTPLEVQAPKLEGYADDTSWSLEYFRFVGHKFTLTESA